MNAPPEANSEYSRASGPSRRLNLERRADSGAASGTPAAAPVESPGVTRGAIALGALIGAVLILVSQFTALYQVHSATSAAPIDTVGTGAHHAWAGIPLALAAAVLAFAVYRSGSRVALVGIAGLGIAMLLIALLSDLPPTHATGLVGSSATGFVRATATRSAGLYMETLGAVVLLIAGGVGLLMLGGSPRDRARPAPGVRRVPDPPLGG